MGPKAAGEVCNIIVETFGDIPYVEGQSYGVIPPGTKINSKGKEVTGLGGISLGCRELASLQ